MDKFWLGLTEWLPYRLRYWTVIRAWADATTGEFADSHAPSMTADKVLQRMT